MTLTVGSLFSGIGGLDRPMLDKVWYNIGAETFGNGALCFSSKSAVASHNRIPLWAKRPSLGGLASRRTSQQRRQPNGGRFAMSTKVCTKCGVEKNLEEFHRQPSGPQGRHSWCRRCFNAYKKRNVTPTAETKRRWNLRTRYDLAPQDVETLLERQQHRCAVCDVSLTSYRIDHDHKTGAVRGILCHRCNLLLAGLEDEDFMRKARAYLARCK